jgi:hypothetical protein
VAKLNAEGSTFIYSTYLGGNRRDEANGVAVDSNRQVYVVGETRSDDFPTRNALQPVGGLVAKITHTPDAGDALESSEFSHGLERSLLRCRGTSLLICYS